MRYVLVLMLAILPMLCLAQKRGSDLVDSLASELPKVKEDTGRVALLLRMSSVSSRFNPTAGLKYAVEALSIAEGTGWQRGIAKANSRIALNYQALSDFDKALPYFEKAIAIFRKNGDLRDVAIEYGAIGFSYQQKGENNKALEYDFKSLEAYRVSGDTQEFAVIWGNISAVYVNMGNFAKALDYILKSLKMNETTGSKVNLAANLGTIGTIYAQQQEFDTALAYYHRALTINEELANKSSAAGNLCNIGTMYSFKGNDTMALPYLLRALKIYEEIGQKANIAIVAGNIGELYSYVGNYAAGITYLFEALEYARKSGNRSTESALMNTIGQCYLQLATDTVHRNENATAFSELVHRPFMPEGRIPTGRRALLQKAREYMAAAIELTTSDGNLTYLKEFYRNIARTDSFLGNYRDAMTEYQQYIAIRDSIYSAESKVEITNLITKREIDLKNKQIELNKLIVTKKRNERVFYIAGIFLLLVVIVVMLKYFAIEKKSTKQLLVEKNRSDELLLNILPQEIAEELKLTGGAEARQYDEVTVMFTDFVNFTRASERMSPKELIHELHTCFKAFDEIVLKYDFEKIKTIGDAYLAVCGLPAPDPLHAEKVVAAAQEIIAFMRERRAKLGERTFEVRIGIHSGSVVAGIVGVKKFAYDIWGDTVNTAARIEQNSEPGKINVSQSTYMLVRNSFACVYRGEIDAKNKGALKMYFVS